MNASIAIQVLPEAVTNEDAVRIAGVIADVKIHCAPAGVITREVNT